MNSTAQLPGVNRPLSVELRLINFCSCGLDSQGEHDPSSSRGVLTKRSDFPRAKGAVQCSPFGGVKVAKTSRLGPTRRLPAFHPAWQARPECLHRALQSD